MARIVIACAAIALFSTSCGVDEEVAPASQLGPSEQLLNEQQVRKFPKGTPARALFVWWRNAQFANLTGFLNGFESTVKAKIEQSPKTKDALVYFAGAIRTARPIVLGVSREDDRAVVYTKIVYRQPVGASRFIVNTVPRAFSMVLEAGNWRLRDDQFMQATVTSDLRRTS